MANQYGPRIVTSGLVLCLDAGNNKSYSGTGNTWTDLSTINNNGTLTNGPTYSSINKGSIVFDGIDDYVTCGTSYSGLDLVDKTLSAWIKKTGASNKGIVDKDFDNGGTNYGGWGLWIQSNNKLWFWNHGNQDILDNGSNTVPLNTWTHVAVAYNYTSKTASFYINGVLNSSLTNTNIVEKSSGSSPLVVGTMRGGQVGWYFDGNISSVLCYNRLLTQTDIIQNYNATKGRYGL